jgi:hypothetical protein
MVMARGTELTFPDANPVILVPRRADNGWRDQLWRYARARLERELPDWRIHEGHHDDGPFNRSAAINAAAAEAGDWSIALIADSDTVAPALALTTGAELARQTGWMVNCHDLRVMLNERATRRIIAGRSDPAADWRKPSWVERIWYESPSAGVVVRRDLFDRVGGFDEKFVGWGHEDSAFRIACETVTGAPMLRVAMDCYHLWHPESPEVDRRSPTRRANMQRLAAYERFAGGVTKIDQLTGGPR